MGEQDSPDARSSTPKAELADDVEIGPYAVIEAGVEIGDGSLVGPFCTSGGADHDRRRQPLR